MLSTDHLGVIADSLAELADDQIHHVYPTFGREHITDRRAYCWCSPRIEFVHSKAGHLLGAIIIHEVEQ